MSGVPGLEPDGVAYVRRPREGQLGVIPGVSPSGVGPVDADDVGV